MENLNGEAILLYDGLCPLCNGVVRFVLRHEREPTLRFASLQSGPARELLRDAELPASGLDSILLFEGGKLLQRSDAVLGVTAHLEEPWRSLRFYHYIPRGLRDFLYDFVARNRYGWFGRRESCDLPRPDLAHRFLDVT